MQGGNTQKVVPLTLTANAVHQLFLVNVLCEFVRDFMVAVRAHSSVQFQCLSVKPEMDRVHSIHHCSFVVTVSVQECNRPVMYNDKRLT